MQLKDRTCGKCGHWYPLGQKAPGRGECCADVPFWVFDNINDTTDGWAPSFVRADDTGAVDCDRFTSSGKKK